MSVFVIMEDDEKYFEMMVDIVKEADKDSFIIPGGDAKSKMDFRLAYLDYLITPSHNTIENLKQLIFVTPDYFILDFGLLNMYTNKMDSWGGIFRQEFIKKCYPAAKVVFFSIYSDDRVTPYMEFNDYYFSKRTSDSFADMKSFWKTNIEFFIKK